MAMLHLKTPLCEALRMEVPVINAGMAEAAGVELAAAVSNAGGLGVLGATMDSPEEPREKLPSYRSARFCHHLRACDYRRARDEAARTIPCGPHPGCTIIALSIFK